jgi:L-threonylcarbamoyladenylate synthase
MTEDDGAAAGGASGAAGEAVVAEAMVAEAAAVLARGSVIAVPTDTVYGLAARLDRDEAVAAIFELKGRPDALALPVLVAGTDQAQRLVARWPAAAARLAVRFWPGALTVVVPARPEIGARVGGDGASVGIRNPRHGAPPCTSAAEVVAAFGPAAGLVVDGGRCDGLPSTVVDCTGEEPACLREGAIPWSAVTAALA